MSRISIDVTPEEHQRLKAMAALQGKSIKEFVLESTIGSATSPSANAEGRDHAVALDELEALLEKRLANARTGGLSSRTVEDIVKQLKREAGGRAPNG